MNEWEDASIIWKGPSTVSFTPGDEYQIIWAGQSLFTVVSATGCYMLRKQDRGLLYDLIK